MSRVAELRFEPGESGFREELMDYKRGNRILRKHKGKQVDQAGAISVAGTQGQPKGGSGNADQKKKTQF